MAAAAETATYEISDFAGDWIVVLPRRKKQRRIHPKASPHENTQVWAPSDLQVDLVRYSKLMEKLHICMKKLESSKFYEQFLGQLQSNGVFDCFSRVLGSEPKMQLVIYGIGSIESFEPPRMQLCLAISMKKKFDWIGDIEVFDPVLSATESRALEALGCSVLTINEQGRRLAVKPTLFFMPHCEAVLYNNLLEANWRAGLLRNMALFGNSFEAYEQYVSVVKDLAVADSRKHILAVRSFANEFRIKTVSDDYFRAFHESSWHFFSPDPQQGLLIV
ncbi:sensitivity to red-light reduced protein [Ancistrocladus abbreviatus]